MQYIHIWNVHFLVSPLIYVNFEPNKIAIATQPRWPVNQIVWAAHVIATALITGVIPSRKCIFHSLFFFAPF